MLTIEVPAPIKTDSRYEFRCTLRGGADGWRRLLPGRDPSRLRFGFESRDVAIAHHELWDAIYPLMFLTRNGGPLFHTRHESAVIRVAYPIPRLVRDFYVRRAADFGLAVTVEADTTDAVPPCPTEGHVLAFGGGKDSRLLLGVLREAGRSPRVVTAGAANAADVPGAWVTTPLNGVLADRVMPALMARGRHFYFGSGLGEAHRETPWHQYFDWGSPRALGEFSRLLAAFGVRMALHAPAAMLPYNLIQRILFERYPELFAHQRSVEPEERTEKNLHVSLCEIHHGIPFHRHCSEGVFRELLDGFVRRQLAAPFDFGYRNHRETIHREMRAIAFRHRDHALFAAVRTRLPGDWDGPWIDYVHAYVAPEAPAEFLEVYSRYALTVDAAPAGVPMRRIRV